MWVYKRRREVMALVEMVCPVCDTEATFQILKRKTKAFYVIVPWFSTRYYSICGNCYTIFKIDKERAEEAERVAKNEADVSTTF